MPVCPTPHKECSEKKVTNYQSSCANQLAQNSCHYINLAPAKAVKIVVAHLQHQSRI